MDDANGEPPSPVELALACLVVTLEEQNPGLSDRWVNHAESDALHAEIRRLHAKAPNPALVANLNAAMVIARHIRFVVAAHVRPAEAVVETSKQRRRRKERG